MEDVEDGEILQSPPRVAIIALAARAAPQPVALHSSGTGLRDHTLLPSQEQSTAGARMLADPAAGSSRKVPSVRRDGTKRSPISNPRLLSTVAPISLLAPLFPGNSLRKPVSLQSCADADFLQLLLRRAKEFLDEDCSVAPAYFVQACYAEHFEDWEVDYPRLVSSWAKAARERRAGRTADLPETDPADYDYSSDDVEDVEFDIDVPRKQRSALDAAKKDKIRELEEKLREVEATLAGCNLERQEAERRCKQAMQQAEVAKLEKPQQQGDEKVKVGKVRQLVPSPEPLEQLRGPPLSRDISTLCSSSNKECPLCEYKFTGEGWYTAGCGHRYHLQCLFLHCFCETQCLICKVEFPTELFKTICNELAQ